MASLEMTLAGRRVAISALSLALCLTPALAAKPEARVTGIFSDLYYNNEGGDLLGAEIFIVFADNDGYVAFIQCWGGGTTRPTVVSVDVKGDIVAFTVPEPADCAGNYSGRITTPGFDGVWKHALNGGGTASEHVHLKRKNSYWQ